MAFLNDASLASIKKEYPVGTRVELIKMDDIHAPSIGTKGIVTGVDDTGSLIVRWADGSGLNVLYGIDKVRVIEENK